MVVHLLIVFFLQAEDGIRDVAVTGVQTCALPISFGDLFNDGHIDVVLNNMDSAPTLLRNVVHNLNHWVTLKLAGETFPSVPSSSSSLGARFTFLSHGASPSAFSSHKRSEERRVGEECRSRWSPDH